jgi:hypothetical protein
LSRAVEALALWDDVGRDAGFFIADDGALADFMPLLAAGRVEEAAFIVGFAGGT